VNSSHSDALDPLWLRERLSRYLWREDEVPGHVERVELVQKRALRETGVRLLVRVTLRRHDGTLVEQMYLGSVEHKSRLRTATIAPVLGKAVITIPDAEFVLVAFPNDPRMRLVSEADLTGWLANHATDLANGGQRHSRWRLREADIRLVRYAPEERLTLRCRGMFESESGEEQPFAYIAKQFRNAKRARQLHRNLVGLGESLAGSSAVRLPGAVGCDERKGLVLMEELRGKELKRSLDEFDVKRVMRAVGEMLAALHGVPRRVRETITVRKERHNVGEVAKAIGSIVPSVRPRLDACVARCLAVKLPDDGPEVLLHGACRLKHVFICDGRPAFIDVDGVRMGHPGYDLGHFLSSLYYQEAQERFSPAVRKACGQYFLEGYTARARRPISTVAALWFLSALLIHKQARKYALHLHDDRQEKIHHVLMLTEAALTACEKLRGESSLQKVWSALP
jgi:aminoglycoside phosphotransferase (APT) family kinase protein